MSDTWTVLALLKWTTDYFKQKGIESARLDAEALLAFALGTDRLRLYLDFEKPVLADERARFRELVKQRTEARTPVAYLTGTREFWSMPLAVTPDVLVPRPETETLVEAVLAELPDVEAELTAFDLGTGSGAIALALAKERPKLRVVAGDLSAAALAVAERNASAHSLGDRVRFVHGEGFTPVLGQRFDVIVSNPPYLAESEADSLAPELAHEPRGALFAGSDGAALLRKIAHEAPLFLNQGGLIALELAPAQADELTQTLARCGFEGPRTHRDLGGRARVVTARARRTGRS
ncbi:MAG: peptide chain release factor N(5)-glutamine methyltransferase [Deltaproteobacteria bacterium]|nr:peptide chain release factor N(5)-glutamine methyltransferase [Deltaproteobacteria bacterium]